LIRWPDFGQVFADANPLLICSCRRIGTHTKCRVHLEQKSDLPMGLAASWLQRPSGHAGHGGNFGGLDISAAPYLVVVGTQHADLSFVEQLDPGPVRDDSLAAHGLGVDPLG